jgi:Uma2 family endonuclease
VTLLTAEEFESQRFELAEGGRWCELIDGTVIQYAPPEEIHGNYVLNLSKQIAHYRHHSDWRGACCFELGILAGRDPDSVLVPAISFFPDAGPFELSDEFQTERCPALVIEVISTRDRERRLNEKLPYYFERGVQTVWILGGTDKTGRELTSRDGEVKSSRTNVFHSPILPDLELNVSELLRAPEWWS